MKIHSGLALCDGGTYIAPDGTQVTTPDLRDRFIVGAGGGYSVGATGGTNYVTLTVEQIPSHNHTVQSAGVHYHRLCGSTAQGGARAIGDSQANGLLGATGNSWSYNYAPGGIPNTPLTEPSGEHTHIIDSTGGNQPHENRPPYYALAFIMKL